MKKQIQEEEDWKQMMTQQQEYNRQIMEEEKILEKAKKDLLIQQYQQFQQENQKKIQDNVSKRIQEQTEMDQKIQQFRQDEQSRQNFQKELRSFLSNNYKDQIANKKQADEQFKKDKIQEEQLNIQRAQQSLQQEQQLKFQQRQQAKQEMLNFYNNKKKLQTEQIADRNQQREEYRQMIQQQAQIQQIKEDNYRKYYQQFDQFQSNVAKNFIPFDHNKEKRIQDMIDKGIQQDQQRQLREEENRKQNQISRRVDLKTGLQEQLAQKEKNGYQKKGYLYNQEDILSKSLEQRSPAQYQSLQPSQQQLGYQNQTENKVVKTENFSQRNQSPINAQSPIIPPQKQQINRYETPSYLQQSKSATSLVHNPLLNPIPNNIQNPYLLKQLGGVTSLQKLTAGRVNYANLASSNIMTPKANQIF
ncbi:hypothetical protein TTHERM_00196040 (macronuclear) [Tetrahymena thermophila SB210]|uniref:Uncharacterized protein n=1 Tax=Tetrahymena thermophila (strain SB210) TaxID=312017 RepID=Q23K30_TETTS|nr:hypothetical protein TTHERM_00196040 [Tetrahymena thermophila SB210]EAR97013.4 hypothetical protein TTHERM_00196040 [Tetrahymena thermophila SB210]|eukprot:XP_001017258.4 hypothetical protein TTHERM_00196040 [Tetrahymena thermophila SB210]